MSNRFFPDLNLAYDFVKSPYFNTKIVTSVNGFELRASLQTQPKFELMLSLPVLSQRNDETEFDQLQQFFFDMKGSFDSFLLKMMDDYLVNIEIIGDGTKSVYNAQKDGVILSNTKATDSQPADPYMWQTDASTLMWNSTSSTPMWTTGLSYTISDKGIITFNRNLKLNETVNIDVEYYYRCRFADDLQQFTLFAHKLWKGEVNLVASLGAHI